MTKNRLTRLRARTEWQEERDAGYVMTGKELGIRYERSESWGRSVIREAKTWDEVEPPNKPLPKGYLPCLRPNRVCGYISIEQIMQGDSVDFYGCPLEDDDETREAHNEEYGVWCPCNLDEKRADRQYVRLLLHFEAGGKINQPVQYDFVNDEMGNGHHRVVAAMDAGFTHVPYSFDDDWGDEFDWQGTDRTSRPVTRTGDGKCLILSGML